MIISLFSPKYFQQPFPILCHYFFLFFWFDPYLHWTLPPLPFPTVMVAPSQSPANTLYFICRSVILGTYLHQNHHQLWVPTVHFVPVILFVSDEGLPALPLTSPAFHRLLVATEKANQLQVSQILRENGGLKFFPMIAFAFQFFLYFFVSPITYIINKRN